MFGSLRDYRSVEGYYEAHPLIFLNSNYGSDIWSYIGYGFGTGIGFFLACFLLNIAHEKLDSDKIPRIFRGYPIMLVYIGVISLAFYALAGYTVDF